MPSRCQRAKFALHGCDALIVHYVARVTTSTTAARRGTWDRAEIEAALTAFQEAGVRAAETGDWSHFSNCFHEDADYIEHAYGTFRGRAEIHAWVTKTMTSFPGNVMTGFPMAWWVIDQPTGRVISEVRNLMPDPGDGSVHEESNMTILTYGGNGLWACEEDIYNPMKFASMALRWAAVAEQHGRLPEDGAAFVKRLTSAR